MGVCLYRCVHVCMCLYRCVHVGVRIGLEGENG